MDEKKSFPIDFKNAKIGKLDADGNITDVRPLPEVAVVEFRTPFCDDPPKFRFDIYQVPATIIVCIEMTFAEIRKMSSRRKLVQQFLERRFQWWRKN